MMKNVKHLFFVKLLSKWKKKLNISSFNIKLDHKTLNLVIVCYYSLYFYFLLFALLRRVQLSFCAGYKIAGRKGFGGLYNQKLFKYNIRTPKIEVFT